MIEAFEVPAETRSISVSVDRTSVAMEEPVVPREASDAASQPVFPDEAHTPHRPIDKRTEAVLRYLKDNYAIDAVQFYDNNFFLREDHAREQARSLLERVGISEKADAFPDALSGGQKQRVAIARSLAMVPG